MLVHADSFRKAAALMAKVNCATESSLLPCAAHGAHLNGLHLPDRLRGCTCDVYSASGFVFAC